MWSLNQFLSSFWVFDRLFVCQCMQKCATDRQKVCQCWQTFGHWQTKSLSAIAKWYHWQTKSLSVMNFQNNITQNSFLQKININNHKPKSFLSLVKDAHKDSAANREKKSNTIYIYIYIFFFSYIYIYTYIFLAFLLFNQDSQASGGRSFPLGYIYIHI